MNDHQGIEPAPTTSDLPVSNPKIPAVVKQRHASLPLCLALALFTFLVYLRTATCGFVNFDDPQYIAENVLVQRGLTLEGIKWAFTTNELANWHPLTWLSFMVDCQVFGLHPGRIHLENVVLHVAVTLLLLRVLVRMTGAPGRSALVAALFALHPLHVESVAWVSERKDMLSTLCWLLATSAYLRYASSPSRGRMAAVAVWLAIGLLVKPMLVTFPCTLLLLDYWPLRRFGANHDATVGFWRRLFELAREKWLLFVIVLASSLVTFLVQKSGGAVQDLEVLPWNYRLANVPVSYVCYLGKTFWPVNLAAFYPLPPTPERAALLSGSFFNESIAATVLLALISLVAYRLRKPAPYLLVGWLWYLGTLVPVIGLVQVGEQAMADRYTYVPLLGIFIMVIWGVGDLAVRLRVPGTWLAGGSMLMLAICAALSWRQIGYWRDTETLFKRAIAVAPHNSRAENTLGAYLIKTDRSAEGKQHLRAAIAIDPGFFPAMNNLGGILAAEHHDEEAAQCYRDALRVHPDSVIAHGNLGNLYARSGQLEQAVLHYVEVLRIVSARRHLDYKLGLDARSKLELLLPTSGTADEAMHRFSAVAPQLSLDQLNQVRSFYAAVLAREPRFEAARQAIARFNAAGR